MNRNKILINTLKHGQLGNRLFYLAHLLAYSLETNSCLISFGLGDYASYLNLQTTNSKVYIFKNKIICNFVSTFTKAINSFYPPKNRVREINVIREYVERSRCPVVLLNKWNLYENALISKHQDAIINILSFRKEIRILAKKFIDGIKKEINNTTLIGVHIRRGDYKIWKDGRFYYSISEYENLISHIYSKIPDSTFIIFSDENLTREDFTTLPSQSYFSNNSFAIDLVALSSCDFIIGPPSTFNSWASFMGKKPLYTIKDIKGKPEIMDFVRNNGNINSLTN